MLLLLGHGSEPRWFLALGSAPPFLSAWCLAVHGGLRCVRWPGVWKAIDGSVVSLWWLAAGGLREVRLTAVDLACGGPVLVTCGGGLQ